MANNKRPHHADDGDVSSKRPRTDKHREIHRAHHGSRDRRDSQTHSRRVPERQGRCDNTFTPNPTISHAQAVQELPPSTLRPHDCVVPEGVSVSTSVGTDLPALPPVKEEYREVSFRHKSHYNVSREVATSDVTYERLEFLGDAYLELFASRLIYGRYAHLPAGRMSQLRELLVKNETLAEYSRAYGFDKRVEAGNDMEAMMQDSRGRGNKGYNKIIGDVFEAYLAAVVLSDIGGTGFVTAERWCEALWAPKLIKAAQEDSSLMDQSRLAAADPLTVYDPEAKPKLQRRLCPGNLVRLHYDTDRPTVELKGDKLGQNVHFIALYVESAFFGIDKKLLAKGEGKNKVEAGNWAAIQVLHGPATREFIEDLEQKVRAERERRRLELEEKRQAAGGQSGGDAAAIKAK